MKDLCPSVVGKRRDSLDVASANPGRGYGNWGDGADGSVGTVKAQQRLAAE